MPEKIETIPESTRWEMATKGLTGAYIAISNALKQAVGQKKFDEFNGPLWHEAGRGARQFAESFELPTETAGDIEMATHLLAKASMGPEFVFEIVETTKDRCVGKTCSVSLAQEVEGARPPNGYLRRGTSKLGRWSC